MAYKEVKIPVDFPVLENKILDFWEEKQIFKKTVENRPADKPFIFYEGPPTANGKPGIHHVIARTIKDFVCRFKTMQGYQVKRKAGWDTHGLPVEIEVEKKLGFQSKDEIEKYGVDKFNKECRESVFTYLKEWNELTRRMGYWVDLDNPYITYTNEYIESVWWLLAEMFKKDLLYQGFKILPYCPRCETALSSHETSLGYQDVKERAVTVKFPLVEGENRFILAWTTTPWTLPGNVALAVGADIPYVEIAQDQNGVREIYYLAETRLEMIEGEYEVLKKLPGKEMDGWQYHPLFDFVNLADGDHKAYYVAVADFVTTEEGTGIVHTAVMYGEDDYRLGLRIGLPAVHTVDEQGHFNEHVPEWKGKYVKDPEVEKGIVRYLKNNNRLYREDEHEHSYPFCWRCDSALLYYAKKSWYIKTTAVRDRLIENNQKIDWYPKDVGTGRFGQWLENNVDWAISRDRYWGTPLNIWICDQCGEKRAVEGMEDLKSKSGLKDIADLHKPFIDEVHFSCPRCDGTMKRTPEVIDCWFDSGAMPYAQFHHPFAGDGLFEANFPADFISEGIDQTRGWFYSLLAISTLISGTSCYKSCISIGLILDKDGQKMSKRKGNIVDPNLILGKQGADVLRWYLFTVSPPWVPTRFDEEGVVEVQRKFFGTLANTYGFFVLYANIDGFKYGDNIIGIEDRPEIDRWLISSMHSLIRNVNELLKRYDVTKAARAIQNYVMDDLSNWYIRRNRRRFWKAEMGPDKLSAYQTLHETLITLSKLIAPFSPFLVENIYQNLNGPKLEDCESVHLAAYPDPADPKYAYQDEALENRMNLVRQVVTLCRSIRNEANIKVRQPLERAIVVMDNSKQRKVLEDLESIIREEINVHQIEYMDQVSDLMVKKAKPVFKALGPKFGTKVNQIAEMIREFGDQEIGRLESGETIKMDREKNKNAFIDINDIEVEMEAKENLIVQSEDGLAVALDTRLTDTLIAEGMAREFVNRVQNMRKEAGFDVTDRIKVYFQAGDLLKQAIQDKMDYIKGEVLAVSIDEKKQKGDFQQSWKIDQHEVQLGIEKIEQ